MQPIPRGWRQMEYYDPKTRKFTMVDTCFDNHHVTISDDDVVYGSGSRTGNIGWVDIKRSGRKPATSRRRRRAGAADISTSTATESTIRTSTRNW